MMIHPNPGRWGAVTILVAASAALGACGESNTYVAPPPPKVMVAKPVEQKVTRYFESTGNASAL